ncbi:F-box protein CPR1 [Linum grandiflorum]
MNAKGKHGCRPPQSHRSSRVWKKPSFMNKIISFLKNAVSNSKARRRRRRRRRRSSFLPEEMVLDIMVKLPAKTLLRFKCLSTGIQTLIQSPYFVAAHVEHQRKNHACIALLGTNDIFDNGVSRLSFPFLTNHNFEHPWLEYVGSWNGLVCLNICTMRVDMVLWNPTTSEYCFAPPLLPSLVACGFGYDSVSDDYKSIVFVKPMNAGGPVEAQVLSWKRRSWRKLTVSWLSDKTIYDIAPYRMTSKGRVNWVVYTPPDTLLSFKLGEEKFEWISPPPTDNNDGSNFDSKRYKCVWKGSLALLDKKGPHTSLWLFNDDEDRDHSCRWSKLFTVQTDSFRGWMSEKPENIWRFGIEKCKSLLVYRYDDRLALASIAWELDSRIYDHLIHLPRFFEFARTLVSIPGSGLDS